MRTLNLMFGSLLGLVGTTHGMIIYQESGGEEERAHRRIEELSNFGTPIAQSTSAFATPVNSSAEGSPVARTAAGPKAVTLALGSGSASMYNTPAGSSAWSPVAADQNVQAAIASRLQEGWPYTSASVPSAFDPLPSQAAGLPQMPAALPGDGVSAPLWRPASRQIPKRPTRGEGLTCMITCVKGGQGQEQCTDLIARFLRDPRNGCAGDVTINFNFELDLVSALNTVLFYLPEGTRVRSLRLQNLEVYEDTIPIAFLVSEQALAHSKKLQLELLEFSGMRVTSPPLKSPRDFGLHQTLKARPNLTVQKLVVEILTAPQFPSSKEEEITNLIQNMMHRLMKEEDVERISIDTRNTGVHPVCGLATTNGMYSRVSELELMGDFTVLSWGCFHTLGTADIFPKLERINLSQGGLTLPRRGGTVGTLDPFSAEDRLTYLARIGLEITTFKNLEHIDIGQNDLSDDDISAFFQGIRTGVEYWKAQTVPTQSQFPNPQYNCFPYGRSGTIPPYFSADSRGRGFSLSLKGNRLTSPGLAFDGLGTELLGLLRSLDLSRNPISDNGLEIFLQMRTLQELTLPLNDESSESSDVFFLISKMRKVLPASLKKLEIGPTDFILRVGYTGLPSFNLELLKPTYFLLKDLVSDLSVFPHLETLVLPFFSDSEDVPDGQKMHSHLVNFQWERDSTPHTRADGSRTGRVVYHRKTLDASFVADAAAIRYLVNSAQYQWQQRSWTYPGIGKFNEHLYNLSLKSQSQCNREGKSRKTFWESIEPTVREYNQKFGPEPPRRPNFGTHGATSQVGPSQEPRSVLRDIAGRLRVGARNFGSRLMSRD